LSLDSNTSGSNNVALGRVAGSRLTTVNSNIVIGHSSGVRSRFGQVSDRCVIDNIYDALVNNLGGVARFVVVDPDGRLGTVLQAAGPDLGGFSPGGGKAIPQSTGPDTRLNAKVEDLQQQAAALTAQLKEQAVQIQKVRAQLEASKPAPKVVANK